MLRSSTKPASPERPEARGRLTLDALRNIYAKNVAVTDRESKRLSGAVIAVLIGVVAMETDAQCSGEWTQGGDSYRTVDGVELHYRMLRPERWTAGDMAPAYVFVYGGSFWKICLDMADPQIEWFSSNGYVVLAPEYRICRDGRKIETHNIPDVKAFYRWARANADALGIDPDRIVGGGESAGCFLSAVAAITPGYEADDQDLSVSSKPNALFLIKPVLDISTGYSDWMQKFSINGGKASPVLHLAEGCPPTYIIQGTIDNYGHGSQTFMAKARELGIDAERHLVDSLSHGDRTDAYYDSLHTTGEAFLKRIGMWPGSDPSSRANPLPAGVAKRGVRPASEFPPCDVAGRRLTGRRNAMRVMVDQAVR